MRTRAVNITTRSSILNISGSVRLLLIIVLLLLPTLACSLAQPGVDADATATAIAAEAFATQTAEAVGSPADDAGSKPKGDATPVPPTATPDVFSEEPALVTVTADGTGDFATLEEAVAAVAAGSTIQLGAGTYQLAGPLAIDRALVLEGAGMDETEIVGTAPEAVVSYAGAGRLEISDLAMRREGTEVGDVFWASSGEARLAQVRLSGATSLEDGTGYAGARFSGSATGYVAGCEAFGNNWNGLRVEDQAVVEIVDSVVSANVYSGIVYTGDSSGSVMRTACTGNGYSGISLNERAQVLIDDNNLDGNTESGLVYFEESSGTASNNMAMNNGLHGISVNDDAAPTLEANTCSNNAEDGIVYFERAGGVALRNTCEANGLHGIGVADEAAPVLEENDVSQNTEVGIRFSNNAGGVARGNEVSANSLSGIVVTGEAAPLLENNVASDNVESGLAYFEGGAGTASGNHLFRNGLHGISVNDTAAPVLEQNLCEDNTEVGIRVSGDAAPQVSSNTVSGSGMSGMVVREQAMPAIEDNVIEDNAESGILYFNTSGGTARRNVVIANGTNGISVNDAAQPVLEENELRDNVEAGLSYFETAGGIAQGNTITGNQWGIYVIETATPALGDNTVEDNDTDYDDRRPAGARPTPPPDVPGVGDDNVLFSDDFTWPDPGWWGGTNDNGEVWFEAGEAYLLNWTDAAFATHTTAGQWFTDAIVTVDSRHVEGTLDNWHDVMCRRQDADNHYLVGYSADGYVKMLARVGGETTYYLDISASPLVNQGTGVTNQIELSCAGNTVRFVLNGSLVGEFTDDALTEGDIALSVSAFDETSSTIAFDNLVVRKP